ncbi:MAG: hypothetical protein QNK05_04105 [Myxococcota bacterium]|nr:hypothetical protein [Myxococcota bacterium]
MGSKLRASMRGWVLVAGAGIGSAAGASITGVCPDGSIFIVQRESQIPCSAAKRMEPHEVPPMRPELLPRPYTWQVWNQQQDPNNPYNLIDSARQVQGLRGAAQGAQPGAPGTASPGANVAALPPDVGRAAPGLPSRPLDLGMGDEELRSLFQIVELTQEKVPVQFARNTADGRGVFRVAFARSVAFEGRLREAWESRGGLGASKVLLFTAFSKRPVDFHANFTFVQGHLTYQPDSANPKQIGVLQGRLGELEGGEGVLGYVVLPETLDLGGEIDVYWNDRRTTARFGG